MYIFFSLHETLKDFWAENLFPLTGEGGNPTGGLDRLVYASNSYALRARSDQLLKRREVENSSQTQLDFPFLSYKRTGIEFNNEGLWNNQSFAAGIYIDEIGDKVYIDPISITFEGIFWCSTENDLQWAINRLRFIADGLTEAEVASSVFYGATEIPISAQLNFNSVQLDPTYDDNDWLTQNKIHTIGLDFQLDTFAIRFGDPLKAGTSNYALTEKVIFSYAERNCNDITEREEIIEKMWDDLGT